MAKLSVSLPDDLVDDLRGLAGGNVSAFVTVAIRHEVDRLRLFSFLEEMEQELGPVDQEEVDRLVEAFAATARSAPRSTAGRPPKPRRRREAS